MTRVLAGIRVVERATWGFVPSAAVALADWGAEADVFLTNYLPSARRNLRVNGPRPRCPTPTAPPSPREVAADPQARGNGDVTSMELDGDTTVDVVTPLVQLDGTAGYPARKDPSRPLWTVRVPQTLPTQVVTCENRGHGLEICLPRRQIFAEEARM